VTGDTEEERDRSRAEVRQRIAFYSTRTYLPRRARPPRLARSVGEELHDLSKDQRWEEMTDLVTDEMVATFAIEAPPKEVLAQAEDSYGGIADRVVLPLDHGEAFLTE